MIKLNFEAQQTDSNVKGIKVKVKAINTSVSLEGVDQYMMQLLEAEEELPANLRLYGRGTTRFVYSEADKWKHRDPKTLKEGFETTLWFSEDNVTEDGRMRCGLGDQSEQVDVEAFHRDVVRNRNVVRTRTSRMFQREVE